MLEAAKGRTRVVGYVRVSSEQQADGGVSLDAQRQKLEAYALAMELELVGVEVDAGVSAKTLRRPGFEAALALLESGATEGLLVCKLDRLTRSVHDLGWLLEPERFGGRWSLLSVADSIDTRSAGGRLVLHVLASVSQWEREAIGERTRDALDHIKGDGAILGGEALGWTRREETDAHGRRTVGQVEHELSAVRRIYSLHADGLSLRAIAARLDAEGHRTKRGGRWHPHTIARVLRRAHRTEPRP